MSRFRASTCIVGVLAVLSSCTSDDDRAVERRARAAVRNMLSEQETDSALRALYSTRDEQPRWVRAGGLTDEGERLVEAIRSARRDGLDPEAYGIADAEEALERAEDGQLGSRERAAALAAAELALSRGWADLIRDLRNGGSDPAEVMPAWRITPEEPVDGLRAAWDEHDPAAVIAAARPAIPEYERGLNLLDLMRDMQQRGPWPEVAEDHVLRPGQKANNVARVRARLLASEFEPERVDALTGLGDNARFDPGLEQAVRSFQRRHSIEESGVVDARTAQRLNLSLAETIRIVELNLERWRWMPHDLGQRVILVNLPAFSLQALENDAVVLEMNTVIGKPAWPTPIFADTMTHIVVNPYWNVPESILAEELLPAVREDESFFDANNYELVDADGRVIDHSSVDWSGMDAESSELRVRQRPGPGNALGKMKFMFPNQNAVYLHDTPAQGLFDEHTRAYSHGCVRVARPMDLANLLLDWSGSGHEAFDNALAQDDEKRIDLDASVHVYLAYFTMRVGSDGIPVFLHDPYDLDDAMTDLLKSAPGARLASARPASGPAD